MSARECAGGIRTITACADVGDDCISERLPTFALMGVGLACLNSEYSIEQEDALVGPLLEVPMRRLGERDIRIYLKFFVDVLRSDVR